MFLHGKATIVEAIDVLAKTEELCSNKILVITAGGVFYATSLTKLKEEKNKKQHTVNEGNLLTVIYRSLNKSLTENDNIDDEIYTNNENTSFILNDVVFEQNNGSTIKLPQAIIFTDQVIAITIGNQN